MKREQKKKVIAKFATHEKDTGSPQVQIAVLTERINHLTEHLSTHKNDIHSRRGLLKLVGQRRGHLQYLKTNDKEQYEKIIDTLNLRK